MNFQNVRKIVLRLKYFCNKSVVKHIQSVENDFFTVFDLRNKFVVILDLLLE